MKFFTNWAREETAALREAGSGKTLSRRFAAYRKSERNEAKLFLIAMVPALLLMIIGIPSWSEADAFWKGAIVLSAAWFVGVAGFGLLITWRFLMRAIREGRKAKHNG